MRGLAEVGRRRRDCARMRVSPEPVKADMTDAENTEDEERRIAEVMQIAESLAVGERQVGEVHDGYTRLGTAMHGSFRFKWLAHEQVDGRYVIDETVGIGTVAVKSRPMPKDDVLAYIDERQRLHFQKVEDIRREWSVAERARPDPVIKAEPATVPVTSAEQVTAAEAPAERDPDEMYDEIRRMLREQK